jgi:hypothetical protein
MRGKKIIKKRPGVSNSYFSQVTQESIQIFQTSDPGKIRDEIFEKKILPAFTRMATYWVYSYGTEMPPQIKEEMLQGCAGFLHDSIHKWNVDRTTKAFSYFNVVARNWVINAVNNFKKKGTKELSINDLVTASTIREKDINQKLIIQSPESDMLHTEYLQEIRDRVKKIRMGLADEKDIIVIDAIEKIFNAAEHLDFMNKSALFIYIREICGLDKRTISKSMSRIRRVYAQIREAEKKR